MNHRKLLQQLAFLFLILLGVKNLLFALPLRKLQWFETFYIHTIHPGAMIMHHIVSFLLGLLMLLFAYRLYKRVRLAWLVEVSALSMSILEQVWRYHRFTIPIVVIELFVLIVLCMCHEDFQRKSNPVTLKTALGLIGVSVSLLLANATLGIFLMRGHFGNIHDLMDALLRSIQLLIFMDTGVMQATGRVAELYAIALVTINWICLILAAILLLKPLIYTPIVTKRDRERVRDLVNKYGQNTIAYLALEPDKTYLFGTQVEGVCAYTIKNDVFLACGDPICKPEDAPLFLQEIVSSCQRNSYHLMFLNVTDQFYDLYGELGFGRVKYGEDAAFYLPECTLSGGKVAKVRAAINHANKAGIIVSEYRPQDGRDFSIERQMQEVTSDWLKTKGGYEMQFLLGGMGLSSPMDRRYFVAFDCDNTLLGFVIFLPFTNGYLADVTRRRKNAPQGVLEKIIWEAFMTFKEEGVLWGNMGMSPLYNVADSEKAKLPEKLFSYIYENLNSSYGFQQLHHAKAKYAPTHWQPRYLVYSPKPFSPKLAYALVRCQIKEGFWNIIKNELIAFYHKCTKK